jgi:hypothetical protein
MHHYLNATINVTVRVTISRFTVFDWQLMTAIKVFYFIFVALIDRPNVINTHSFRSHVPLITT